MRHNLSLNDCFIKVLKDPNRPWGKDNYWTINEQSDFTSAGVESYKRRRKRLKAENDASSVTTDDTSIIRSRANSSSDVTESSYDHPIVNSNGLEIAPSCSSRGSTSGATTPNATHFTKPEESTVNNNNYDDITDNKSFITSVPAKADHDQYFMSSVDKLLEAAHIKNQYSQIYPSAGCIPVSSLSTSVACVNMPLSSQFAAPMNNLNLTHMPQPPPLGHHLNNATLIYPYNLLYRTCCPRSQPTDFRYASLPYYFTNTASNAACGK